VTYPAAIMRGRELPANNIVDQLVVSNTESLSMSMHSRQLAEFAAGLRLSDVPTEVVRRAQGIALDGLGCALYASNVKWTDIVAGVVGKLEPNGGQATVWGRRESASAVDAALVNGTMVQGYELDDTHSDASIHNCAVVLPAALAAAEYVGANRVSGERLLAALIAGFEVGPRVSRCMSGERLTRNGWHAPAVVGSFPAAVAAGVVLGLNADQFFHALGIAGTQACGLMAAQYGSMVKRMQCAKNSQSGLYAALLAAEGFTGIENIFEEKYGGFCSTFSHSTDAFELDRLTEGLREQWETLRIVIKPYACRHGNHTSIKAAAALMKEHALKAADVESITVRVTEAMVKHSGWSPYEPKSLTTAQMHLGFCVAMQLIEGDVFIDQMIDANVGRPDLVALANRVQVVRDPEREKKSELYRRGCSMEVMLTSGTILRKTVDFAPGTEHEPLGADEISAKFRRLAARTFPEPRIAAIEKRVCELDGAASAAPLIEALRGA
jgi:2-methylcitrate dehydratase PrpD